MKNPLWSAVYELFAELDTLVSREERFEDRPASGAAAPAQAEVPAQVRRSSGQAGFFRAYVAKDDLVEVRAKLRSRLDMLKASLAETLTEREGFLVLFPLVIYFDELVQERFVAGGGGTWPPLQTELFHIDHGGAAFYETLDDLLRKPDTLPFVYEIFYLCLSSGFKGRHSDNLAQIEDYKSKLRAKIPVEEVPREPLEERQATSAFATSQVWIYAAVAGLLVVSYLLLGVLGRYTGA